MSDNAVRARLAQLEAEFRTRVTEQGRLTRDVAVIDQLLVDLDSLALRSGSELGPPIARLRSVWQEQRADIALAQSVASAADLQASDLTLRAKLVLHRYVRHFSARSRRTRDLGLLDEIVGELRRLGEQLRPLRRDLRVATVQQEVDAVGEFIGFFVTERDEVASAWNSGSLDDRSQAVETLVTELAARWQGQIAPVQRGLRRPATVRQLLDSLARAVDTLRSLQHANLPDDHDRRLSQAEALFAAWQEEQAKTTDERARIDQTDLRQQLLAEGVAVIEAWRTQPEAAIGDLRRWCDRLDDVERQLRDELPSDGGLQGAAALRDHLVLLERAHDARAQDLGGAPT